MVGKRTTIFPAVFPWDSSRGITLSDLCAHSAVTPTLSKRCDICDVCAVVNTAAHHLKIFVILGSAFSEWSF